MLKDIERSGEPIVVTLRGRPMVRVEPFSNGAQRKQLGSLKGRMHIPRDLVWGDTTRDWEALK